MIAMAEIDSLMRHSVNYERKLVIDPHGTETVTNVIGEVKTYVFGKVDDNRDKQQRT